MSKGPERRFIDKVNGKVSRSIHRQANTLSANGTPDYYYDYKSDVWIEYKFQTLPKFGLLVPDLSALQRRWIERRELNAFCCVGFHWEDETYGVIFQPGQLDGLVAAFVRAQKLTVKEVAEWIERCCGYSSNPQRGLPSK